MKKTSLLTLHTVFLCCITEFGFSQQIENENATAGPPSFVEMIDGNVNPEKVPMAVIYDILSSALVDNGPSNCSELPANQSVITTVAPCRGALIEGMDPRTLERLGEVVLDFNRSEDEIWKDELCIASVSVHSKALLTPSSVDLLNDREKSWGELPSSPVFT